MYPGADVVLIVVTVGPHWRLSLFIIGMIKYACSPISAIKPKLALNDLSPVLLSDMLRHLIFLQSFEITSVTFHLLVVTPHMFLEVSIVDSREVTDVTVLGCSSRSFVHTLVMSSQCAGGTQRDVTQITIEMFLFVMVLQPFCTHCLINTPITF